MPERFLALCQFNISFEGFWKFAWNFSVPKQLKAVFFRACDSPVPRDGFKHLWKMSCARFIFQCPTNRHKKAMHTLYIAAYTRIPHLEQHLWLVPAGKGWERSDPCTHVWWEFSVWHMDHVAGQLLCERLDGPYWRLRNLSQTVQNLPHQFSLKESYWFCTCHICQLNKKWAN